MNPGRLDLAIYQGGAFRKALIWKTRQTDGSDPVPKDLTGYTGRAQVRIDGRAELTFDTEDETLVFGAEGQIDFFADVDVVAAVKPGAGSWSLEVQPPVGDRLVLLMGRATIVEEVTR